MFGELKKKSFSVLIPFYNEASYLERTLKSWLNQTQLPDQIICVDNGSTDNSMELAEEILQKNRGAETVFLNEKRPGKIHALETGCRAVSSEYVVLADADTFYPPHYLQLCCRLFDRHGSAVSSLMALPEYGEGNSFLARMKRRYFLLAHKIRPKHGFTGGYGHVYRFQALVEAGGFNEELWPYVLLDHEIIFRLMQKGRAVYDIDLWCIPSLRRERKDRFRWTLLERFVYVITPYAGHRWFFYRFLGPRLEKRGMSHLVLREKAGGE
jgi:glycosyltransferase involved in cell wall biosynthesis